MLPMKGVGREGVGVCVTDAICGISLASAVDVAQIIVKAVILLLFVIYAYYILG